MSEQNVAVVRSMWEAFLRNDFEAALSAFEPNVEWDGTNLPDGNVSRGLDAVVEHLTKWAETWETWEIELEQVNRRRRRPGDRVHPRAGANESRT
jgi:hypothetical protein